MTVIEQMGEKSKKASKFLASASSSVKNKALEAIAKALIEKQDIIISENAKDMQNAKDNQMSTSLQDRLLLNKARIEGMASGVTQVMGQDDPIGKVTQGTVAANGMQIQRVVVPLGVIGIIFEARPNVTADAAALCLKSGNTVILRGGKEAINSNKAISEIMRNAIESVGLPKDCIQLIEDTTRESANELMTLNKYLDVLIPRGSAGLIKAVVEKSTVAVIETGAGNCHVYVDEYADTDMAANIIFNAKTSRPSVCNAIETVLVHKNIAKEALPKIKAKLDEKDVLIHGDEATSKIIDNVVIATKEDWEKEYLDYEIAIRVVESFEEAVEHISEFTTGHSECIVTEKYSVAQRFLNEVDAAAVYVNASTRFTDGGEFGLGAEIGISTQKLHTRGPMGVNELTSTKFVIRGDGQVR